MKEFTVVIEETVVQEFNVMANSAEDAVMLAEKKYKDREFVLESGEVQFRQMSVASPSGELTEWIEF